MTFIIFILDKINQFFCSHKGGTLSTREVGREKSGGANFTCSWEWNVKHEVHCNKCGKKWNEFTFE